MIGETRHSPCASSPPSTGNPSPARMELRAATRRLGLRVMLDMDETGSGANKQTRSIRFRQLKAAWIRFEYRPTKLAGGFPRTARTRASSSHPRPRRALDGSSRLRSTSATPLTRRTFCYVVDNTVSRSGVSENGPSTNVSLLSHQACWCSAPSTQVMASSPRSWSLRAPARSP